MNVFEEFDSLVKQLETRRVRYALVGGVAMAFYAEPRFTQDIDLLIDPEDLEVARGILEDAGYFESAPPWTFRTVPITLHRFLKIDAGDEMIIDILLPGSNEVRRVIHNAVEAVSEEGSVRVASKEDLVWLKGMRDSSQDRADIEKLKGDDDEPDTTKAQ